MRYIADNVVLFLFSGIHHGLSEIQNKLFHLGLWSFE